jgi:large subunit ribosomal protein L20
MRKREFRSLWIQRLNASTRIYGMPYNVFINALNNCGPDPSQSDIRLNRKVLADLAVTEPLSFRSILEVVKQDATNKKKQKQLHV